MRKRKKKDRRKERKTGRGFRLHREGERLRSEPETDELMLETTGGPCFRASNDLAGATRRASGTDADDGCGEGTGAYPGTVPFGVFLANSIFGRADINFS